MTLSSKHNLDTCRTWTANVLFVVAVVLSVVLAGPGYAASDAAASDAAASDAAAVPGLPSTHVCCDATVAGPKSCEPVANCGMIQTPQECPCRIEPADDAPVGHVLALSPSTVTFGPMVAPQSNPQVDIPRPRATGLVPSAEHLRASPSSQPIYILNRVLLV